MSISSRVLDAYFTIVSTQNVCMCVCVSVSYTCYVLFPFAIIRERKVYFTPVCLTCSTSNHHHHSKKVVSNDFLTAFLSSLFVDVSSVKGTLCLPQDLLSARI